LAEPNKALKRIAAKTRRPLNTSVRPSKEEITMSQLSCRFPAVARATTTVSLLLSACSGIDPSGSAQGAIVVTVSAFETSGHAEPKIARGMALDMARALDADPYIEAQPQGGSSNASGDYILEGSVYADAEGQRAFVALRLLDVKTAKRVWSENYDYRGIGAEAMAADIANICKHLLERTERSRLTPMRPREVK
jgi:hypothetical protein